MEAAIDTRDGVLRELAAEVLRGGNALRVTVAGSSMAPALWPGDELTVRAIARGEAARGDLLLFVRDGRLCTHRLMGEIDERGARRLLTRGDTALRNDPPMSWEQILGAVVSVRRDGHAVSVDASRSGRLLAFGIRHSGFLRRVALKIHAIRRHSWTTSQTRCRA